MSPSTIAMEPIVIDKVGDLVICIPVAGTENEVQEYLVCRRTVQRLYQDSVKNEMFVNPQQVINVETAHPRDAATLAFLIAHAQFTKLPTQLSESEFYDLLKFTNELGITHILRPFAGKWSEDIDLAKVGEDGSMSKRLFISWELGDRHSFDKLVTHVAFNVKLPSEGDFAEYLSESVWFKDFKDVFGPEGAEIFRSIVGKFIFPPLLLKAVITK